MMIQERTRTVNRVTPSWILSSAIASILALSSMGRAADAPAQTQAQRQYDVPAGTLDRSLKAFASQAGVMLSADAALTARKTSRGLQGRYTTPQGFQVLLAGSGLEATEGDAGSYSVRALPSQGTAADRTPAPRALSKIEVEGDELYPDGSAEQGYRRNAVSAVGPWQGRSLQDTPYSITVISSALIENLQATTPDQIYRIAPTVQLLRPQYANDGSGINMRGFGVWTAYRDGVPGDYYGHGTTTEDTESVEILTGLSGFLYGPGNVGGVINYVSKRPTAERLNRMTVGNGGGSNYYAQGDFGGPLGDKARLGYRVNAIYQDGDTAIDHQDIKKRFVSGAFDWHVTDTLLWQFDGAYRNYEVYGGQAIWSLAPGASRPSADDIDPSVSWGQKWQYRYFKTQRYGTQLRWDASDAVTLRAAWLYNNSRRNNSANLNRVQPNGTYTQTVERQYVSGDNPLWTEQFDRRGQAFADIHFQTGAVAHKLTAGTQYRRSWQDQYTNAAPNIVYTGLTLDHPTYFAKPVLVHVDRGPRGTTIEESSTTLLVGDDVTFSEHWSLLAGLAHSTIDVEPVRFLWTEDGYSKSAVTPNVSLIYKPVAAITAYASYIESLERGGTADDQYNGQPVVNAGHVMKPLISKQVEVGLKATVGQMLLTTALFQIDKALEYYDLRNPTAPRYVQDGRRVHRGIEFTAFGKVTDGLTLTGGFTLLDAKVKEQKQSPALEGKRPSGVAETLAKLHAEYKFPLLPALSFTGGVSYVAHQYVDAMNTDRLPGYTLLDFGARYHAAVVQYPLTLRLDVNNLADKAYWAQNSVLSDPRTVLFSVSTEF